MSYIYLSQYQLLERKYRKIKRKYKKQEKIIDAMARDIYVEHQPHFATEEAVKKFYERE